jgi:hypothetical protein
MRKWETQALVPGSPSAVLEVLTEPDAIAEWAPVPFEIVSIAERRVAPEAGRGWRAGVLRSSLERLGRQLRPVAA